MEYKDYYKILGVPKNADEKTIKQAYRKLARTLHPDVNPGDPEAERKFKEVNEAYTVLSDPEKRKMYDRFGAQWEQYQRAGMSPDAAGAGAGPSGAYTRTITPEEFEEIFGRGFGGFYTSPDMGGVGGDFSEFFDALFGGGFGARRAQRARQPRRGRNIEANVEISLEEAFRGATRLFQKDDGQRIEVKIPRGADTGSRVRVSGQGAPGVNGGPPGDLYLNITVRPHPIFRREGDNLRVKIPVDLYTAILGGEVQVPTLERPVMLKIPAGTQNGRVFRLRGLGMPNLRNPDKRGDLLAEVEVKLPTKLTPEQRRLFEQLRDMAAG
ncbi:MAG: DnaJ domain-containing protein [Chloroflexi bacterium]|nr:DnaJ domain-containing protein [Chloroflexota bacterium]